MITLILGGARSGKSTFAEKLAFGASNGESKTVTYIATADAQDLEMEERIAIHKKRRPNGWHTWEGEIETLPSEISRLEGVLLLDCLTLYLSRLFLASPHADGDDEKKWIAAEGGILESVEAIYGNFVQSGDGTRHLIVVSNEVGFGLVPPYRMGRRFRDLQGRANQLSAGCADNVALVVAGLPLWIKGNER